LSFEKKVKAQRSEGAMEFGEKFSRGGKKIEQEVTEEMERDYGRGRRGHILAEGRLELEIFLTQRRKGAKAQ